jgi:hypothetical protein
LFVCTWYFNSSEVNIRKFYLSGPVKHQGAILSAGDAFALVVSLKKKQEIIQFIQGSAQNLI